MTVGDEERRNMPESAADGEPVLPDYTGPCLCNVVPVLLDHPDAQPAWLPEPARGADRVVLLLLDGLGWQQLESRRHLAPTLSSMAGGPIASILPTTTAAALTSLSTGLPP